MKGYKAAILRDRAFTNREKVEMLIAYEELERLSCFLNTLQEPKVDLDFRLFAKEMGDLFSLPKEVTENTEENPLNWEYAIARHFCDFGYRLGLNARK